MFQAKVVEQVTTHILCSIAFLSENLVFFEIMWRNIVQAGRTQMKIWLIRVGSWIPKAMDTNSVCRILIDFPLQQWLPERASILRYTLTDCLVSFLEFGKAVSSGTLTTT